VSTPIAARGGSPTVSARFFDMLDMLTLGPSGVSNNLFQESMSVWLLCRRLFDTGLPWAVARRHSTGDQSRALPGVRVLSRDYV